MVLVIEDDLEMVLALADFLQLTGHAVVLARSGSEALECASTRDFELILLDLVLPDKDGLVLLARLRALTPSPIIVCSAQSQLVDRVLAFKVGADDFVAKPFGLEELQARITAVLRRSTGKQAPESNDLRVGELVVMPTRGTASLGGQSLQLTPTEFRLLAHLARHPDKPLSRRGIAGALWTYADEGTDHIIDVHIARLRRKMREAGAGESMIVTVHGTGYLLTEASAEPASLRVSVTFSLR
jgi:DNA-binding response OmpR family regulator